jgi:hypothetical protein
LLLFETGELALLANISQKSLAMIGNKNSILENKENTSGQYFSLGLRLLTNHQ